MGITRTIAGTLFAVSTLLASGSVSASAKVVFEADSAAAIESRTRADFPYTVDQAMKLMQKQHPEINTDSMQSFLKNHYIEGKMFDGNMMIHRKAPKNINLLHPKYTDGFNGRGSAASDSRIAYVDSVIAWYQGRNPQGLAHEVTYEFTIDVPYSPELEGDTIRVWMPLPMKTQRQPRVEILSTFPSKYILSDGRSVHNSIYMEQPVVKGKTTHFSTKVKFENRGQWNRPEDILANLKPYDKNSEFYKEYTAVELPHIIRMDSLAKAIVGDETNPFKQSEMVYDYIIKRYPWAGAREYSTLECIPEYVITQGFGDCGQVSLLYISLMRTLGVPARWESGWMLHPHETNWHDWAEVYFEGIGWVPVDTSFGRYVNANNDVCNFYSHGMDAHRMASNLGVCGKLYPEKKFVRSETVDFQAGEVETTKGNLFYPYFDSALKIIDIHPLTVEKKCCGKADCK